MSGRSFNTNGLTLPLWHADWESESMNATFIIRYTVIYSLLLTHLKTNTMSELISLGAAARKYGIKEETIRLWVELEKFEGTRKRGDEIWVNGKILEEYLIWRKTCRVSIDYLEDLEMFCYNQTTMNDIYREVIKMQEIQINHQQGKITELEKLSDVIDTELERVHEIERVVISRLDESLASRTTHWMVQLWRRHFSSKQGG